MAIVVSLRAPAPLRSSVGAWRKECSKKETGCWQPSDETRMPDYALPGRSVEKFASCFTGLRAAGIRNVLAEGIILLAFVLSSTLLRR